jgi:hypothetical protein
MDRAPDPEVSGPKVPVSFGALLAGTAHLDRWGMFTAAKPSPTSFFALGINGRYVQAEFRLGSPIKGVGLASGVVMKG